MSGTQARLPPGFVLDTQDAPPITGALPPGFVLDGPAQPEKPGVLDTALGAVRQAARGATFGFGDEIAAGVGATAAAALGRPGTWSENYDAALAHNRERDKAFEAQHPYLSLGAQVAGAVANPVSRLSAAGSLPARVGMNSLINAGLGGVAGFGEGEGGFHNRMGSAGTGAAGGALIGAVVPAVGALASAGARKAAPLLGLNVAETDAKRTLVEALRNAGSTVDDVKMRLDPVTGQPMALADVGGENVLGLAQYVGRKPGAGMSAARDFVEQRGGLNQSARLEAEIKRAINAQDFTAERDALLKSRSTAAAPLYEKAFSTVVPKQDQADAVMRFVKDPIGQEALQKGMRILELEHLAAGTKFDPKAYGVMREGATAAQPTMRPAVGMPGTMPASPGVQVPLPAPPPSGGGKWVLEPDKVPNLRLFDAVKRGYDEIVEGFRNDYGKLQLDQYGRAVNNARAVYTGTLRQMFPEYGDALNAWAGPSKGLDAMNLGARVLRGDADETSKAIAQLSPSEKDMFRIGVARALTDKVQTAGDTRDMTKLRQLWGSQSVRERVAAAFDDPKEFQKFGDFMDREMNMALTNQAVDPRAGSITAKVLMRDQQPSPSGPWFNAALNLVRGNPGAAALNVMPRPSAPGELKSETAAALAPYLFTFKAGDRARLLDALLKQQNRDATVLPWADRAGAATLRGLTAGAVQLQN